MSHLSSLLQDVFCWQAKLLVYVHNAVAAIFEFIRLNIYSKHFFTGTLPKLS